MHVLLRPGVRAARRPSDDLEALAAASNPFSLITRGPLIVRDVDVPQEAARRAEVSVVFSVPTVDDEVWRTTGDGAAAPAVAGAALAPPPSPSS